MQAEGLEVGVRPDVSGDLERTAGTGVGVLLTDVQRALEAPVDLLAQPGPHDLERSRLGGDTRLGDDAGAKRGAQLAEHQRRAGRRAPRRRPRGMVPVPAGRWVENRPAPTSTFPPHRARAGERTGASPLRA